MPLYIIAAMLGLGFLLLWRLPRPQVTGRVRQAPPSVDVIIPARNEAGRITPLLESLREQTFKPTRIFVVDDDSSDDTALIARRLGAHVLSAGPRPAGWNGKTWACWQGAHKSEGEILVFLDADTWLAQDGLEALLDTFLQREGLLSVQPYHVTQKAYEQLSAFFNIILLMATNAFTPLGERLKPGGALGPCMVCSRADYMRLGGHAAVRSETLEDIPLGKRFIRAGLPVRCLVGRGVISFRMYPGGFRELVEGWSKGFGYGAFSVHLWATALTSAWITACFSISTSFFRQLCTAPLAPNMLWRLGFYAVCAGQIAWMLRRIGRFHAWVAWLFPIPLLFFGLVMLRSLVMTYILGQVRWKGHTIATSGQKRGQP